MSARGALLLLILLPGLAPGAAGGPDGGGVSYADSDEPDGPPWGWLDTSGGTVHSLGDDDLERLTLPFDFGWYGATYDEAWVSSNGALFFEGATSDPTGSCPASGGSWAGIAAFWDDLEGATVRSRAFGQYPHRSFAVEWLDAGHPLAGGTGTVQLWLLEAGSEAVVLLDDVTFGSAAVDGGAGAVVGVQGAGGEGLAWSCTGGLSDGSAAWFYGSGDRPADETIPTAGLTSSWRGVGDWSYAGQAMAAGDLNADGVSDLVVGQPSKDTGLSWILFGPTPGGMLADVGVDLRGEAYGDQAGRALAVGDLDGDGYDDVVVGSPQHDGTGTNAGAAYLVLGPDVAGDLDLGLDADWAVDGPSGLGQARLGEVLATPGDVDGDGYDDLLVAAPDDDVTATNTGSVFLFRGGLLGSGARIASGAAQASFYGGASAESHGTSLTGRDRDGDRRAHQPRGAPDADPGATNAGQLYIVPGDAWSGTWEVSSVASSLLLGEDTYDEAASSLLLWDLDESGGLDLIIGAPGSSAGASGGGLVYLLMDPSPSMGTLSLAASDTVILGNSANGHLGRALAAGLLDADASPDLIISAPSESISGITSGGVTYVFTHPPRAGFMDAAEADHQVHGSLASATAGSSLALLDDWNGDGYGDLALGAPLASTDGHTFNGAAYLWSWFPSFADEDGDGFVSIEARALDCDDHDAGSYPGAPELAGDLLDNDCDGWVDGIFRPRHEEDHWLWDLEEDWGSPTVATFDFEIASDGDEVSSLYAGYGVHLDAAGSIHAATSVDGAQPVGDLGAALTGGTISVELRLDEPVDALAMRLLDAYGDFEIEASGASGAIFGGWTQTFTADNLRGGAFLSLELAQSADSVTITSLGRDGWGLDELQLVWSSVTDNDRDGFTEADGDCDDEDAAVGPHASEIWDNGIDDDCDGVVDGGGAELYTDETTWRAWASLDEVVVDFEDQPLGALGAAAYESLGLDITGSPSVVLDVDGAAPRDSQAARAAVIAGPDRIVMRFEEPQPALALWLLDLSSTLDYRASRGGTELYAGSATLPGDDLAGGVFLGFVFDAGVDELEISTGSSGDSFGIDDLILSALGLDDADGDGYTESSGDCDDEDATVSPDAEEIWYDGVDQDCDGGSDYDSDGDGFDSDIDCDDGDSSVNPDAEETWYDGVDQDCDGLSDNDADGDGFDIGRDCNDGDASIHPDAEETYYDGVDSNCESADEYDADGDGWSISGGGISGTAGSGDCDDSDPSISPGAEEIWYDGVDQDCAEDGDFDADGDGFESDEHGGGDCDDTDDAVFPGAGGEVCYDGLDRDCDGADDYDCDGDGWSSDDHGGEDCDDADSTVHPGAEDVLGDGVDQDCDGANDYDGDRDGFAGAAWGGEDCDDSDPRVSPDGIERCGDGVDQDCDGWDDLDCDGDGWDSVDRGGEDCDDGDGSVHPEAVDLCYDGIYADCGGDDDDDCDGDGYASDAHGGADCDDTDASIHPSAYDYPYDGVDQDCDGIDDFDRDGDGWTVDFYGGSDCDDTDASIHPGAPDLCYDGVDANCSGNDDDDCDGDGHRSDAHGGDDCDDSDPLVSPSAEEICGDGVDQDCDGGDLCTDIDGDGWADTAHGGLDCDDDDATVHPGALDSCYDGVDADCDGADDYDCDGDGHRSDAHGGADCDDSSPEVSPEAEERWYDGVDADCDGADDYDQDGDGHRPPTWGGGDCDDADPDRHPGVLHDGCGSGDEDCDGEVDEDCGSDSGIGDTGEPLDSGDPGDSGHGLDTGDSEPGDSEPGDTGDSQAPSDSGETAAPEDSDDSNPWTPVDDTGEGGSGRDKPGTCGGCGAAPSPPLALLWLAPLGLARRRRQSDGQMPT